MPLPKPERRAYICTWCGRKIVSYGRPAPGNCPRKGKDSNGKSKPHTWVRNT